MPGGAEGKLAPSIRLDPTIRPHRVFRLDGKPRGPEITIVKALNGECRPTPSFVESRFREVRRKVPPDRALWPGGSPIPRAILAAVGVATRLNVKFYRRRLGVHCSRIWESKPLILDVARDIPYQPTVGITHRIRTLTEGGQRDYPTIVGIVHFHLLWSVWGFGRFLGARRPNAHRSKIGGFSIELRRAAGAHR